MGQTTPASGGQERRIVLPHAKKRALRHAQQNLVYLPEDRIGWYPYALRRALQMTRRNDFDFVYASAGPTTSLLVASHVAKDRGVPWIGELRHLWSDNHYRVLPPWYRGVDARLKRWVLRSASGLITMSDRGERCLRTGTRCLCRSSTTAPNPGATRQHRRLMTETLL